MTKGQDARIYTLKDGYIPKDLLQYGCDHLRAAEKLFHEGPYFYDSAGYLTHMGLELILKAWVLHTTGTFKAIHSLEDILKSVEGLALPNEIKETLTLLSGFSKLRYPERKNSIEIGLDDIEHINKLINFIQAKLPAQLLQEYGEIPSNEKGGRILMVKRNS